MGWDSDGISDLCAAGRAHCISKVQPLNCYSLESFWQELPFMIFNSYGTHKFSLKSSDIAIIKISTTRPSSRLGLKVAPVAGSLLVWQTIGGDGQVILNSNNWGIGKDQHLVSRKNIVAAVS